MRGSAAVEFGWSEEERAFRATIRALLAESLPPDWAEISKDGPGSDAMAAFSRAFCGKLAERGLLTGPPWRHAILSEECWAVGEPRGPQYMNVNWIGPAIARFGSDAQKAEHLPRIARGEALWCQGFSEPDAGSDLASLRTRAERRGEHYVVNGQKVWTSYCRNAEHCFLLVRTGALEARHRALTVLLVPMGTPGIEVREIDAVIGERYFHELFFTDVEVPLSARLGEENEGWSVAMHALQFERVGAPRWARAARALDRLAASALDGAALERLGEARALCEAARLLHHRVVSQRAHDIAPTADANVARVANVMADRAAGELALELLGSAALEHGSPGDAGYRSSMSAGIATGATEVQLDLIAERWLGLPRSER